MNVRNLTCQGANMITVRSPLFPLDKADLADNKDNNENEDHGRVHLGVSRVLLVHPDVFIVEPLLGRELVPLDAVPVYRDVLVLVAVAMTVASHFILNHVIKIYKPCFLNV